MTRPAAPAAPNTTEHAPAVAIVLVGTTHPGNIGATARAMKTMGLAELRLVAPRSFPHDEATARAVGADDVLPPATVHPDLAAALTGIDVAYATSARDRHFAWPTVTPREAAAEIHQGGAARAALVFGPEHSGLANDDLERCQRVITIPTAPDFSSLNLGQAVQICAYELFVAAPAVVAAAPRRRRASERPARPDELDGLHAHWLRVMEAVEYVDPARPKLLDRRLRRLLSRAAMVEAEVQILRGFLTALEARLGR